MKQPILFCVLALTAPAQAQVLYFAETFFPASADGGIQQVDTGGANVLPVLAVGAGIKSVAVHAAGGKVYWCDTDNFVSGRVNLDGTSTQNIITSGLQYPSAIAIDEVHSKFYWGDQTAEEIW